MTTIHIESPVTEHFRTQAGQIYYAAFRRKFQPLVGNPAATQRVLTAGLDLHMALGATAEGDLRGIAGLESHAGRFSHILWRDSVRELGLLRGFRAWSALNWFARGECPAAHLRVAALAVAETARGQGYGSRLLEAVCDQARREGFRAVQLEVVDTNTGARRLYERLGFVVVGTHRYPIPPGWLGFSGEYVLVKTL